MLISVFGCQWHEKRLSPAAKPIVHLISDGLCARINLRSVCLLNYCGYLSLWTDPANQLPTFYLLRYKSWDVRSQKEFVGWCRYDDCSIIVQGSLTLVIFWGVTSCSLRCVRIHEYVWCQLNLILFLSSLVESLWKVSFGFFILEMHG